MRRELPAGTVAPSPWRYAAVEALLFALLVPAAFLVPPPERGPVAWGLGCAFAAALCALPAVHFGLGRGTNGLLAGFTVGFFARAALVALGLVASGARGAAALPYVCAFFVLYALTQGVEIVYVTRRTRLAGSTAPQ